MKRTLKRITSWAKDLCARIENGNSSSPLFVLGISFALGSPVGLAASPIVMLGIFLSGVSFLALSAAMAPSKEEHAKIKEEYALINALGSLNRADKYASHGHGETAISVAAVFKDLKEAYEKGSAITPQEMEKAVSIVMWVSQAHDILEKQSKEIAHLNKYVADTQEKALLEESHNELKLKITQASEVMSGYYSDISEAKRVVLQANQLQTELTLSQYPEEATESLTYLRKAEHQLTPQKISRIQL